MQRKKLRLGWTTGILSLVFLGLISCGTAQKDSKQTEAAPVTEQTPEEAMDVEQDTATLRSLVEETDPIKLNPPHGEPGHRCEIPVGSPLNAPAGVEEATRINTSPPPATRSEAGSNLGSMAPTVENAQRLNATQGSRTTTPATGEKPKTNPAHGQPWHRCDIAVGAPLP